MKRTNRARTRNPKKKKTSEITPVLDELKKLQDENLEQVSGGWCCGFMAPPCY